MASLTMHIIRIGLLASLALPLSMLPHIQLNSSSALNTVSLTTVVDNLYKQNFLSEATYQEIKRLIELGEVHSRSSLLHHVIADSAQRWLEPYGLGESVVYGPDVVISGEMPVTELQQLLQQLNDTGALSPPVYEQLQEELAAGRIRLDITLFEQAETRMEQYEQLQPEAVAPHLRELNALGILSDENLARLLQDLGTGQIDSKTDFVNYFDRALLINLQDYSSDPNDYFLEIHQAIAQMLAETDIADIRLEDFRLEVLQESDLYHLNEDHNLIVSARVNGRLYQQGSYYFSSPRDNSLLGQITEGSSYRRIDIEEAIHLFNKILRDQASPYRVYAVANEGARCGILALTEQQFKRYSGMGYSSYGQSHDNSLTSDRIEEALTLYEQIGLLNHLTPAQIDRGRQRIAQTLITRPYELLMAFDNTVVVIEDWESGNVDNPYQEFTREFAAASHGAFAPTDISNEYDWESETAGQSFTINGTRYSTELDFQGDWLDPNFFTFIQGVVEETSPESRLYPLYGDYELVGYLFLTEQQRRTLEAEKLVTLESPPAPHRNTVDGQNSTVPPNYAPVQPQQTNERPNEEWEGWIYIGSMNRAQQAYYAEHEEFATTLRQLELSISEETGSYRYTIATPSDLSRGVIMMAQAKREELRSFASAVWLVEMRSGGFIVERRTMAETCETEQPSTTSPELILPTDITQTSISCSPGSRQVNRLE
ncbi:type IV pilin-like G/H family protein [Leptolyngbya sp. CCNP1308]|uniref:type IV pilin-like G/H family protein n=1 Tax=Leptolyngbya sp. CCNP1308 TaxID=3110255 RepID=UPI002B217616|nr:type IV pilin-like G/H family protein [Leptolyngbya sp. CCNP1308]MEA5448536.1 type IV pilin-like G/H family protein [Leptolyngbya sp. CCNP1308]